MKHGDTERLLSRKEVAEIFGIPIRFLELAARRGEGPRWIKVGRLVRYRCADIRAWIDQQAVEPQRDLRQ